MSFVAKCKERFDSVNSVLCIGLDPVIEKIPLENKSNIYKTLIEFYFSLIDNFSKYVLAYKPNIAFYEQYGIDGYKALKDIIERAQKYDVPVILDAKRGDIGNTSLAYAKAAFDELGADALTLSPYLGEDSLAPFFKYKDKGFFILNRTSNKGGKDFQLLELKNDEYLYIEVSRKIINWNKRYSENIGAVAGATHIEELQYIASLFSDNNFLPVLIPGVGRQGGDFDTVISVLKDLNYPLHKVFINSSSKINYAYLEHPDDTYLEASYKEIQKMML